MVLGFLGGYIVISHAIPLDVWPMSDRGDNLSEESFTRAQEHGEYTRKPAMRRLFSWGQEP